MTESERHSKLSLSVSDPLQRDANQVHLPATQRLLAAHHASEQRGRSLQLPRYRHEATNYHTHGAAISSPARVSGNVWSSEGRGDGKTGGGTGRQSEGVLYPGMEGLSLYISWNLEHKIYFHYHLTVTITELWDSPISQSLGKLHQK